MKATANLWLSRQIRLPGILAGAILYPDQTAFAQTNSAEFPLSGVEQAVRRTAELGSLFLANRMSGCLTRWAYERAMLHAVTREDGILLVLFADRHGPPCDSAEVERLMTEFQHLRQTSTTADEWVDPTQMHA